MGKEGKMIKAYKGFDKDLKCRGFQYEVGKEYVTDHAIACTTGFHCCENPFDVFGFYAPCDNNGFINRFCEVEAGGDIDTSKEDKISCTHLKVKAEIGLHGLIKAGVKFIFDKIKWDDDNATNTGDHSAATNTGNHSAATNTGDRSAATNTGDCSAATNTGNYSAATNTGNYSAATNTGDHSAATNTGNNSAATNTGDRSAASVEGKDSIAIVTGKDSKAKGALGCWIVLTERGKWDGEAYPILDVKAFKVDGVSVEANTWYKLKDGKLIKAED